MALSTSQWKSIHDFQENELQRILGDKVFLESCSRRDHYSRIGQWVDGLGSRPKVLELGCGSGRYVAFLERLGCDVIGVDPVRYETWGRISSQSSAQFQDNVFAENLPFDDGVFVGVACLGAMLYFDKPDKALAEIRRILRPNGSILLRNVNSGNLFERFTGRRIDPASRNTYSINALLDLLARSGFQVRDSFSYGFYPPVFQEYYWYLVNGKISLGFQELLSAALPSAMRVNHVVFAVKQD